MRYQPIENHGIDGNMHSAALVSLDGSVDWPCPNRALRTELLDAAVWQDVVALLQNPQQLDQEYQRRLQGQEATAETAAQASLRKRSQQVQRGIARLIDACADGLLEKAEWEPRLRAARERLGGGDPGERGAGQGRA